MPRSHLSGSRSAQNRCPPPACACAPGRESLEITLRHLPGAKDPLPACQVRAAGAAVGRRRGRMYPLRRRAASPTSLPLPAPRPPRHRPLSTCWWRRLAAMLPTTVKSWSASWSMPWGRAWCWVRGAGLGAVRRCADGARWPCRVPPCRRPPGSGAAPCLLRPDRPGTAPSSAARLCPPGCRRRASAGHGAGTADVALAGRHHRRPAPPG